jgi:hypothetical protein
MLTPLVNVSFISLKLFTGGFFDAKFHGYLAVMSKNSADENLFGDAVHRGNSTKQRIRKSVQRRTAVRGQHPSVSYPPFVALHNLKRLEINKIKPSANC